MPVAIPLVMAAGEYGIASGAAAGLAGAGLAAAGEGTAAFSAFEASDAAVGLTGLQEAGMAASLVGGIGQAMTGQAQSRAATYSSEVAANNAQIATQNARLASNEGAIQAGMASQQAKAKLGGILANQGASGVDINSGSSVDTRSSAAQMGELNAITIRGDAARKAYGYETDATSATAQSQLDKMQASNASLSGDIGAATTMLSGAANPVSGWLGYQNSSSLPTQGGSGY